MNAYIRRIARALALFRMRAHKRARALFGLPGLIYVLELHGEVLAVAVVPDEPAEERLHRAMRLKHCRIINQL